MIFLLTDELTHILVEEAQEFFASHPIAQEYRWYPNVQESKIQIFDQYPDVEHMFPTLTVRGMVGTSEQTGLYDVSEPLRDDADQVIGESYSGSFRAHVEWVIESTHDADVRRIADILFMAIVRKFRFEVPKITNNNANLELPLYRVVGRGSRNDTTGRVISSLTVGQDWRVTWHDEVKLTDTFQTLTSAITFA